MNYLVWIIQPRTVVILFIRKLDRMSCPQSFSVRRRSHRGEEAVQAPEVARSLNSIGREASRSALRELMARANASGLLTGPPVELAGQFAGLLWRDLMVSLLLGVAERPTPREIAGRARNAAAAFLQLHPATA
jgi:hypothetical protein